MTVPGVTVTLPGKSIVVCQAVLLCTTCDFPAKAMALNMTNFNGFYNCCYCVQPGKFLSFWNFILLIISTSAPNTVCVIMLNTAILQPY